MQTLPPVEIIYGFQGSSLALNSLRLTRADSLFFPIGSDFHLVNASVAAGAQGVVTAGTGAGSLSDVGQPLIDAVAASGIPIVASTKINNGFVVPAANSTTIASGMLNPVKSRRMLQVLLALGKSNEEIRAAFEEPLGSYLTQF